MPAMKPGPSQHPEINISNLRLVRMPSYRWNFVSFRNRSNDSRTIDREEEAVNSRSTEDNTVNNSIENTSTKDTAKVGHKHSEAKVSENINDIRILCDFLDANSNLDCLYTQIRDTTFPKPPTKVIKMYIEMMQILSVVSICTQMLPGLELISEITDDTCIRIKSQLRKSSP